MFNARIRQLESQLLNIDLKIKNSSGVALQLIKERNAILSELTTLRKSQWDEQHDRVDCDDER